MAKLQVGEKLADFSFETAYGEKKSVKADVLGKRTVFWAIRYIGCTVCRYDVHVLAQRYKELAEKNVQLFVVMQSDPAVVREELKDAAIPFDIVCDPEMRIYRQFDIPAAASKEELLGSTPEQQERVAVKGGAARASGFVHGKYEGDEMQLPAVWIVEADGTLSYVKYGEALADIPTPAELLDML